MRITGTVRQILDATRFLSRLPLPERASPEPALATTLRAAPWAGLLIAAGPALLLVVATRAGLPGLAAASLAVAALVAVTGGLHEDGLADVADGFGGGATVGRKLAIMRDSRIGSYGTVALGLALLLRVSALDGLVERFGAGHAALAMLAAAVLSRGLMLVPLGLLPAARSDGLGRAAGQGMRPTLAAPLRVAGGLGAVLAAVAIPDRLLILAGLLGSAATALAVTRAAQHHIRGVTGDVVGATQQATEIVFLLVVALAAGTPA